ncbi:MAG: hypothetical protein HDR80_03720 [Bacteroides sp.]|nr:hypothetical protein [Bacteroides sp.]
MDILRKELDEIYLSQSLDRTTARQRNSASSSTSWVEEFGIDGVRCDVVEKDPLEAYLFMERGMR